MTRNSTKVHFAEDVVQTETGVNHEVLQFYESLFLQLLFSTDLCQIISQHTKTRHHFHKVASYNVLGIVIQNFLPVLIIRAEKNVPLHNCYKSAH